jgi:sulfonate transport system substrate-binding protein
VKVLLRIGARALVGCVLLVALSAAAQPTPPPLGPEAPFTVAVNMTTIESAPVFVAAEMPGNEVRVINGGIRNVANGSAHAGTNAETQMLLVTPDAPRVRLLLTVAEGLYRVIARKSAGINTLADLRGKRIITPRNTSAHYHLVRMLNKGGVAESDVTLVSVEAAQMAAAIGRRDADAISMWEPQAESALAALAGDATVFQDNKVYRELFSLYTSTDVLNDPKRRGQLVRFLRALASAAERARRQSADVIPLTARMLKQPEAVVSASWKHHAFPAALLPDTLDVMVEEERWIAASQQRAPRTRQQLAAFIDTSVVNESTKRQR